jgi:hypothetical protein
VGGEDELARITVLIADQTAAWQAGKISSEKQFNDLPALEERQQQLRRESAQYQAAQASRALAPADIRSAWETDYSLAEKRAAVQRVLSAVVIHPVPVGTRRASPALIEPVRRAS